MDNTTKKDAYSDMVAAATAGAAKSYNLCLFHAGYIYEIRVSRPKMQGERVVTLFRDVDSIVYGPCTTMLVGGGTLMGTDLVNFDCVDFRGDAEQDFYNAVRDLLREEAGL